MHIRNLFLNTLEIISNNPLADKENVTAMFTIAIRRRYLETMLFLWSIYYI